MYNYQETFSMDTKTGLCFLSNTEKRFLNTKMLN